MLLAGNIAELHDVDVVEWPHALTLADFSLQFGGHCWLVSLVLRCAILHQGPKPPHGHIGVFII